MELADYLSLLIGPFALTVAGGLTYGVMRQGNLPFNGAIGLRTQATMASDEAWRAGHSAAAPYFAALTITGVTVMVVSIILPFFFYQGALYPVALLVVPATGFVVQVIILVIATKAANSAAKRV